MDNLSNHRHTGYDAVQVSYNDLLDKPAATSIYGRYTTGGTTSVNSGAVTLLNYSTTSFSSGITMDTANKAMVVVTAGKYLIQADCMWSTTVDKATYQMRLIKNGSSERIIWGTSNWATGTTYLNLSVSDIIDCAVGDTFDIRGYHLAGVAQNTNGNTGSFSMLKVA
jgi:hypothetical protein